MNLFTKNFKKLWKYAKGNKFLIFKCIFYNIIFVIIRISVILLSAKLIIKLTDNDIMGIIFIGLIIYAIDMSRNTIYYFLRGCYQRIYRYIFNGLQTTLSEEILKIKKECIDKNSSGLFIQRITNDTGNLAALFNDLIQLLGLLLSDIGVFVTVFILNKITFVYFVISTIFIYLISLYSEKKYIAKDKIYKEENEKTASFISETIRGAKDIKILNAYDSFKNILDSKVEVLNQKRFELDDAHRKWRFIRFVAIHTYSFLLILLIAFLIYKGRMKIAIALIIYNSMSKVEAFISNIGEISKTIKSFNLSCERIFSIMDEKKFSKEKFGKKHLNTINGDFEFQNISFSYDNEKNVLNGMSFKVNANETVAFVGKSGAGKSTIFSLLCKLYDNYSGNILIDDIDIKELDRDSLRGNISVISQNPYIFNMSIKDNLKLIKNDLTDEEMKNACRLACLDSFIESLPDKYETIVGEGGVMLSGGQKQRLAIARALIQKTEIILFDEATSALDNETQKHIQEAINNLKSEYTIMIIAHRLSTILSCDRIFFVENGKVIDFGTHKELLKRCKQYKNLYESEIKE